MNKETLSTFMDPGDERFLYTVQRRSFIQQRLPVDIRAFKYVVQYNKSHVHKTLSLLSNRSLHSLLKRWKLHSFVLMMKSYDLANFAKPISKKYQ